MADKKKRMRTGGIKKNPKMITEGLNENKLEEEDFPTILSDCFNRYAKMVLTDRAIPDVRDGLKPVHRRIIFDMWKSGITFNKKTVKCAKTVGDVLGHYHPHGDSSVYDAMVRLSQSWKMRVPLLIFQGNNGDIDNDDPAAYRYTESKLSEASSLLCKDIDEDTVDMTLTYDDSAVEPVVLPAEFPNLLINGASGIAIGNSTNIPTHNPTEVVNAVIYRLKHPSCPVDDLMNIVKGPDFPTGGIIDDKAAIAKLYRTGQATFYIYSRATIDKDTNQIIITEIPYGVVKAQMVKDLDNRRINEGLDNITEIRDESAGDIRIVLDIKKGADPTAILNYLQSKGALRTTFAANMLALVKGHPRTLSLLAIIDAYIDHRQDVITKRSAFEFSKYNTRVEIINGLLKAKSIIDEVIAVIRKSNSRVEAKENMMNKFGFTELQADAIGNMRLYSLTKIDIVALEDEKKDLVSRIDKLTKILSDKTELNNVIIEEMNAALEIIKSDRLTTIADEPVVQQGNVDQKSLIAKEDVMVVLTKTGYFKKTNMRSYQSTINGDPINDMPTIKVGDQIVLNRQATTHDDLLGFTSKGNYILVPVWQIPDAKWHDEGKHLNNVLTLDSNEKIVSAYIIREYKKGLYVTLLSKLSKIKRVSLSDITSGKLTNKPLRIMGITKEDEVVSAQITSGDCDLLVIAQDGNCNRFNENEVPIVSFQAAGVKAINQPIKPVDMACLLSLDKGEDSKAVFVFEQRKSVVINTSGIASTQRLGAKTQTVRIPKSSYTKIVGVDMLKKNGQKINNILLSMSDGTVSLDVSNITCSDLGVLVRNENIQSKTKNSLVLGIDVKGGIIDDDTKVIKPSKTYGDTSKNTKSKKDDVMDQPTFFDIIDSEIGDKYKK